LVCAKEFIEAVIEMHTKFANIIDGKLSPGDETFVSKNPAHPNEAIGEFPSSGPLDVENAVEAARRAFLTWRNVPAPRRAEVLYRAAERLAREKEEFSQLMTREMGKVLLESRGDVQEGVDMLYYVAGEGRRLFGETTPSELPNKFAMSVRAPVGVCACITPWNFPLAIPSWKIAPALVAGNTVVFKPAEDTPLVGHRFAELLIECGLPPGVLNVVHGAGATGAALAGHPGVDLVSFTGSTEVGREVAHLCAEGYKRVSLEMGGKNAIIVMDDADINLAVEGAVWGAFGTSGQRCTASSRLIVHQAVYSKFTSKLVDRAKALRLGDGLDASTDVGPVINEVQLRRIHEYTGIGLAEGAKLLCGGEIDRSGDCSEGWFYSPTVFADVDPKMRIAQEEIFGPTTCIIPTNSFDHAIAIVNGVQYGLSSAIYTADVSCAFQAMRDLNTGIVYVNASTIGAEVHLPFGGVKRTGNGHREGGHAIDVFTEWKSIYVDYSGTLQRAQIDNAE
jgi:acyl-CoA reductase-like NAD-dependent aldehyde dehydrogenase